MQQQKGLCARSEHGKDKMYEQSTSKSKVEAQAARALLGKMRAGALGLVWKTAEQIWIWPRRVNHPATIPMELLTHSN